MLHRSQHRAEVEMPIDPIGELADSGDRRLSSDESLRAV